MTKFSLLCFVAIYGGAVFLAQWMTGLKLFASEEAARLHPLMAQSAADGYSLAKLFLDYGLSGGILVGGYFLGRFVVERLGDRLENKVESTRIELKADIKEIKTELEKRGTA
jgi:hypothetical protein